MSKVQEAAGTKNYSTWSPSENKLFENTLAEHSENDPDRWQNIAKITEKTVDEVKNHYKQLVEDVELIESGQVPLPNYKDDPVVLHASND